jgi:hypothetical protein
MPRDARSHRNGESCVRKVFAELWNRAASLVLWHFEQFALKMLPPFVMAAGTAYWWAEAA